MIVDCGNEDKRNVIGKAIVMNLDMQNFDVIIVGAGASGLLAAKILSEEKLSVCILEARDRIGGRVHTFNREGFTKPIEAGAEFIHGNLDLTFKLLKEAGINYYKTEGEIWQVKNNEFIKRNDFIEHADLFEKKLKEVDEDITVKDFLDKYFSEDKYASMRKSLQQYVEGYDAANINDASILSIKEEWENEDDDHYRVEGGYQPLFQHLADKIKNKEGEIILSSVVKKIKWKDEIIEVITADNKSYFGKKIIITVPPFFLTGDEHEAAILFEPSLPMVSESAKQIGYGGVIKIVIEFDHAFWETGECRKATDLFFLFSEEKIPTWWTQLKDKTPMLTGWLAGPNSKNYEDVVPEIILQDAINSLSKIFEIEKEILQQYITGTYVHNWVNDTFSKGAYSYGTMQSANAKKILQQPVKNKIFFSGEAISKTSNATVDAAFHSGKKVAEKIIKS